MNPIMRGWLPTILTLVLWIGDAQGAAPEKLVRGAGFRKAWDTVVSAHVDGRSVVQVLEHFCGSRRIAWMIDRRLDPDQSITADAELSPLSEALPQLLNSIGAGVVVVGSNIIVGPQEKLLDLRTLAEAQRVELQQTRLNIQRKQTLAQTTDLNWNDLAEPRQLAEQVAQRAKIDLTGLEQIPHDLWRGGHLIGLTAGEALTVLAWQYDLQLKWQEDGRASLVPVVLPVRITRSFTVPETKHEATKSQFPQLTWSSDGKALQASGRVEELEAVDQWIQGTGGQTPKPKPQKQPKDWRDRTFTLRIKNAPLRDVLAALKAKGIPLDWNEEALIAAGIDLQAKVQLDLKNANADELMSALCSSAKLKYEITDSNVKLSAP